MHSTFACCSMGESLITTKIFYGHNFSQSRTHYMCLSLCSHQIRLKWQRPLPWSSHTWEATTFIRMCGQMLLTKSWCGEKGNSYDVYAVSVMKDTVASSLATCPGKYCLSHHCSLLKMDQFCVESWEDASAEHWWAHVSKCFYNFQSFKF